MCEEIEEIEGGQGGTVWHRENESMKHFMEKHHWAFGIAMREFQTRVTKCIEDRQGLREG
jgi:hypothetical protein